MGVSSQPQEVQLTREDTPKRAYCSSNEDDRLGQHHSLVANILLGVVVHTMRQGPMKELRVSSNDIAAGYPRSSK
jgi:hypothetical protein